MRYEKIKELAAEAGFDLQEDGNFYSPPQGQWINQEIYKFAQLMIAEFVPRLAIQPLHEEHHNALYSADYKQSMGT